MQIDRNAECHGTFEDRPERLVVEIAATRVTVDQRAFETELANGALQFGHRLVGRGDRQRGKAGEPLRMRLYGAVQKIVGVARQRDLVRSFKLLHARRIERQHLHVDAGGVHFGNALAADLAELLDDPRTARAGAQKAFLELPPRAVEKTRVGKMFFNRNGSHRHFLAAYVTLSGDPIEAAFASHAPHSSSPGSTATLVV